LEGDDERVSAEAGGGFEEGGGAGADLREAEDGQRRKAVGEGAEEEEMAVAGDEERDGGWIFSWPRREAGPGSWGAT